MKSVKHRLIPVLLRTVCVALPLAFRNAHAGVDFSQVDLFAPFALLSLAIAFVCVLLARGLRDVNPLLRYFAHSLFVLGLHGYLLYLCLFILQISKFDTMMLGLGFAIPLVIGALQCYFYLQMPETCSGVNKVFLATASLIVLPVFVGAIVLTSERTFREKSPSSVQRNSRQALQKTIEATPASLDRKITLPGLTVPPRPVVLFPQDIKPVSISVTKKTVNAAEPE